MTEFSRPLEDPLVEQLLKEGHRTHKPACGDRDAGVAGGGGAAQGYGAAGTGSPPTARRLICCATAQGVVLRPGEDARTVHFIAFDAERQHLNNFTATNQYRVQGIKQCRDDSVLLVNGIPLVVAEYKSYVTSGKGLARGGSPASPIPAPGAADASS